MFKRFSLFGGVLILLLTVLAACGGNALSTIATQGKTTATTKCDPATLVTIVNDAYDRKSVHVNMGDTLRISNKTNDTFTLKTIPDAGLPYVVVDPMEMEHVPFPKAGTFTLSSKEHPNTMLTVVVSSTPGSTCGEKPVATITFGANALFSQTTATVPKGESLMLTNLSTQTLHVTSNPDLGMGSLVVHPGERQTILFPHDGTYIFTVKEYPHQKLTVVVKKSAGGNT